MITPEDYRAAVFSSRVLAPAFAGPQPNLLGIRQRVSQVTGETLVVSKGARYYETGPTEAMIQFLLCVELVEWGLAGCRAGYFPSAFTQQVQAYAWWWDVDQLGPDLADNLGVSQLPTWKPDPFEFGETLQESLEALGFREREGMHLIYFSGQAEWESRLGRLREFAAHLETQPSAFLGNELVDDLAWGLLEELFTGIARTPSRWRFEWARLATYAMPSSLSDHFLGSVRERLSALEGVRERIEAVARDLDADSSNAAATTLRRTLEDLQRSAEHVLSPARPLSPLERDDNRPAAPPATKGRTVRQETEVKYRTEGADDYGAPGSI